MEGAVAGGAREGDGQVPFNAAAADRGANVTVHERSAADEGVLRIEVSRVYVGSLDQDRTTHGRSNRRWARSALRIRKVKPPVSPTTGLSTSSFVIDSKEVQVSRARRSKSSIC